MHNTTLHASLEAFAADAAGQLAAETASGAEIAFEVVEEPGARASLYCYRPLTGAFIRERLGMLSALPTYRSGTQKWTWRASFEVFDSFPRADVAGGQIPSGTYRFVINGNIHNCAGIDDPTKCKNGVAPYQLTSSPFTVSPWTGINLRNLKRDTDGTVSFAVDPIAYPRMPPAEHRPGISFYADDQGGTPGHSVICITCTFRPWATTGTVASAVVVVTGKNGTPPARRTIADSTVGCCSSSGARCRSSRPASASVSGPSGSTRTSDARARSATNSSSRAGVSESR